MGPSLSWVKLYCSPLQAGSENSERVQAPPDDGADEDTAEVELEAAVEVLDVVEFLDIDEVLDAVEDDVDDPEVVDELKLEVVVLMDKVELSAVRVMVEKPIQSLGRYVGSFV